MYQFSENIQRGILYLLKSDDYFFSQIVNLVKPDYFEFPIHGNIFRIIKDHYEEYKKLPKDDFIIEEARQRYASSKNPVSDYCDELTYISNISNNTINDREYFLDLIEKFARKESLKDAIKSSIVLLNEGNIDEIESIIRKATQINRVVDNGQNYFDDYSDRWKRTCENKDSIKYKTICSSLNDSLGGGLGQKELAMVIAPPGVGKSLYLINQAVTSLMEGRKVLYISLEMNEDRIAQRLDSVITLLPQSKTQSVSSQLETSNRLKRFHQKFNPHIIIKEFPCGQVNANTIRAYLSQLKINKDFVPDVICLDYLELLRPTREVQQEWQAQQRVAEDLRALATELNILIWTATQTNRQGRSVRIITDSELGDSYGKIRTCDFAISLNQNEEEYEECKMRAFVVKSRNGRPRITVPVDVDYSNLTMMEGETFKLIPESDDKLNEADV